MRFKYVMFIDDIFLLFPEYISHNEVSINREKVKSSGFVRLSRSSDYKCEVFCSGESVSLKVKSNAMYYVIIKCVIENY
jgi:hypothetical protein